MKNIAFEIVPFGTGFALIRQPSGLILFIAGTEAAVRAHFMQSRQAYVS